MTSITDNELEAVSGGTAEDTGLACPVCGGRVTHFGKIRREGTLVNLYDCKKCGRLFSLLQVSGDTSDTINYEIYRISVDVIK